MCFSQDANLIEVVVVAGEEVPDIETPVAVATTLPAVVVTEPGKKAPGCCDKLTSCWKKFVVCVYNISQRMRPFHKYEDNYINFSFNFTIIPALK